MFKYKVLVVAGLSEEEQQAFEGRLGESSVPLVLRSLRDSERDAKVGAVVEGTLAHGPLADPGGMPIELPWPMVFFAVYPRSEIDATIEAFKSAIDRRAVYASLTPNNMLWTWNYLVEHLGEEHQFFVDLEVNSKTTDPTA